MDLERYAKIENILKKLDNISKEVNPAFAQSAADRWEIRHNNYLNAVNENPKNIDSMKEGKLYADYYNKVQPALIGAKLPTKRYDSLADKLIE